MRKHLLFLAITACVATASAQYRHSDVVKPAKPVQESLSVSNLPDATATFDSRAIPGVQRAPAVQENLPKAWYNRPAGAFWGCHYSRGASSGSTSLTSYYAPYMHVTPYFESTFMNASEDAERYEWEYETRRYETGTGWIYSWYTSEEENLKVEYKNDIDTVPSITAFNADGANKYQPGAGETNSDKTEIVNWYNSTIFAKPAYETAYSNTGDRTMWFSSKFFGANTNRDGSTLAGSYYSIGALDADGGTTGRWYGRNWQGIDFLGMAFEKPEHPYVLRRVGVRYQGLALTDPDKTTTLTAKVYKLDEMKPYAQDLENGTIILDEENLIAEGTCDVDTTCARGGLFIFPLMNEDEGLLYEVNPEIDFPILVVFTGYNTDDFTNEFTLLYSSDNYDEGHGELCYLGETLEDGSVAMYSNYAFFQTPRMRGISILIDVERPFMVWNWSTETGEYTFANDGESYAPEIYTYHNMDSWDVTDENFNDLPEWLTVELNYGLDDNGEEDEDIVIPTITAEPLPEGVEYRECNIKFSYPGAYIFFKAMQGTKPDIMTGDVDGNGAVNVSDVTALVNMILGVIEKDDARADVNGDGVVNVSDVTALVNIILGVTA